MQSVYLQRIMKKNVAKGFEKTKPKQTQFKPCPERIEFTLSVIEGNGPIKASFFLDLSIKELIVIFYKAATNRNYLKRLSYRKDT